MEYYIYGAGEFGKEFAQKAVSKIKISAFIDRNAESIKQVEIQGKSIPCMTYETFIESRGSLDAIVFIAFKTAKNYFAILELLQKNGFIENKNCFDASEIAWGEEKFFEPIIAGNSGSSVASDDVLELLKEESLNEYWYERKARKYFLPKYYVQFKEKIGEILKPGDKIADLGAGFGRFDELLFEMRNDIMIHAVEYDDFRVSVLKKLEERKKQKNLKFEVSQGDIRNLVMFEDNSVNVSLAISVCEIVPDFEKILREMMRITSKDGYIVIRLNLVDVMVECYKKHNWFLNKDATVDNAKRILEENNVTCILEETITEYYPYYGLTPITLMIFRK